MRRPTLSTAILAVLSAGGAGAAGAAAASGCNAAGDRHEFDTGGASSTTTTTTTSADGGGGSSASGLGGSGGGLMLPDAGGEDVAPDVPINPCGTACGPEELCDSSHTGLDDDCDGLVDEGCPCSTGQAHACFKGDPSYHTSPGCFDGTEKCDENGAWGPCLGGRHATEGCFSQDNLNCHPIQAVPFQDVNLKSGTGQFSGNAVPGSEVWTVTCPTGVSPCPAIAGSNPPDDFKPLQSGEYTITYTKGLAGGGTDSCTYPLFVGAPGLRVELEWEHDLGGTGVDLDLHLHQPNNTQNWATSGSPVDCGYANCSINSSGIGTIQWFNGVAPPNPVNWYLNPVTAKNTCFFAPRGAGQKWINRGQGCANPRLDIDNVSCNPSITDPNSSSFCAPENINVDYPPIGEWFRVAIDYFSNHGYSYPVRPRIKIYCDGALGAELGSAGFYIPEVPVTLQSSQGGSLLWLVADVAFTQNECGPRQCVVEPLYADANAKTPLFWQRNGAYGPPYPPAP